jgi:hypothetical protein
MGAFILVSKKWIEVRGFKDGRNATRYYDIDPAYNSSTIPPEQTTTSTTKPGIVKLLDKVSVANTSLSDVLDVIHGPKTDIHSWPYIVSGILLLLLIITCCFMRRRRRQAATIVIQNAGRGESFEMKTCKSTVSRV